MKQQDLPPSSYELDSTKSKLPTANIGDGGAGPGTTVTDMYIRNKMLTMFMANKDTRFENLVYAITAGYASNPEYWVDEADFARRAVQLARAIAFEMAKYTTL